MRKFKFKKRPVSGWIAVIILVSYGTIRAEKYDILKAIPGDVSGFVYSSNFELTWEMMKKTSFWNFYMKIPEGRKVENDFFNKTLLMTVTGITWGHIFELINKESVLALWDASQDSARYAYIIDISEQKENSIEMQKRIELFAESNNFPVTNRSHKGVKIVNIGGRIFFGSTDSYLFFANTFGAATLIIQTITGGTASIVQNDPFIKAFAAMDKKSGLWAFSGSGKLSSVILNTNICRHAIISLDDIKYNFRAAAVYDGTVSGEFIETTEFRKLADFVPNSFFYAISADKKSIRGFNGSNPIKISLFRNTPAVLEENTVVIEMLGDNIGDKLLIVTLKQDDPAANLIIATVGTNREKMPFTDSVAGGKGYKIWRSQNSYILESGRFIVISGSLSALKSVINDYQLRNTLGLSGAFPNIVARLKTGEKFMACVNTERYLRDVLKKYPENAKLKKPMQRYGGWVLIKHGLPGDDGIFRLEAVSVPSVR